jgi:SAM-dependent methyltransferase
VRLRLPARAHIRPVGADDPLRFYYMPLVGRFYRRRLALAVGLLDGGGARRLLEVGYGSGIFLPELAAHGAHVIGVDHHPEGATVRAMARAEGIDPALVTGDVRALPIASGSIDLLVCLSVLEHVAALGDAAAEIERVLRPGGVAVLGYPRVGKLMSALFPLIGFRGIDELHVSTPVAIEAALAPLMTLEARRRWPRGPLPLYHVSRWRKGAGRFTNVGLARAGAV